jgi:competence protein ComEC
MTPSKALFWFCIAFVVGIALQSFINIPQVLLWGFLICGVVVIIFSVIFAKNTMMIISFCLLFLVLGIARLQISEFTIAHDPLVKFNDTGRKITLIGQIIREPDYRDAQQKLTIKAGDSLVLVTTGRYPEYRYLDTLRVTGKLKTPAEFSDFNYKNYLLKDGVYSIMDNASVALVSKIHHYHFFTFIYEKILLVKGKLSESINTNFSPPHSLLLQGIILGNNKNMTQELRDKLNGTGLRYLTAISGVHVVILSLMLMSFLLLLGFWRGQAFYITVVFIWLYIILTGLSASGVRAAIMGSIFLLAQKLGRQNTSSRTITMAAAIMLLQNPLLLLYDVGFQLSFLAAMGIIHVKPLIDHFLKMLFTKKGMPHDAQPPVIKHGHYLMEIFSISVSAQLLTLPITTYNFGNISLVAIITNILVVPIVYFIMVFGFLVSVLGIFSPILGFIFSVPCWILVTYFLKVMDIFYQPWAIKTMQNIPYVWLILYYVGLAGLVRYLQKRLKPKFLGY